MSPKLNPAAKPVTLANRRGLAEKSESPIVVRTLGKAKPEPSQGAALGPTRSQAVKDPAMALRRG